MPRNSHLKSLTDKRADSSGSESARQAELLQLAAELFARQGYVATTIRDIADAAGILSGSLYHHFDSKESILDEILSSFLNEILGQYQAILDEGTGPRETLEGLVRASLVAMNDWRSAIVIYQNEARYLAALERFEYLRDVARHFDELWTGVLRRGMESGEFRETIEPRIVYRLIRDSIWAVPRWYRPEGDLTPERIADQYLSVMLGGIVRPIS
jgi:TetR/AcrR family transcriptional regulator, cholesterol catabolism regulator